MTMSSKNRFSALSEETVEAPAPKPKKVPELKKAGLDQKKPTSTPTNISSQSKSTKDRAPSGQKQNNKVGLSGRPSFPHPAQPEPAQSSGSALASDHIKEETRPSKANARQHREAPAHGREYDRHSATGRVDGEKKDVAGHSWGKAVDVPEGVSAEEALEIVESDNAAEGTAKQSKSEQTPSAPAPAPVETLKTYTTFLDQQRSRNSALASLKQAPRRPNEGNFESNKDVSLKVLSKSGIKANDSLAGLLNGSPKSSTKKTKREKKEKETISIEPRFSFEKSQRPNRGNSGAPRGGSGANRQGPRPQFNNRSATVSS